jgi:hypothetical protein
MGFRQDREIAAHSVRVPACQADHVANASALLQNLRVQASAFVPDAQAESFFTIAPAFAAKPQLTILGLCDGQRHRSDMPGGMTVLRKCLGRVEGKSRAKKEAQSRNKPDDLSQVQSHKLVAKFISSERFKENTCAGRLVLVASLSIFNARNIGTLLRLLIFAASTPGTKIKLSRSLKSSDTFRFARDARAT